jgi:sterol desaturase/sphingolipid hydroxylase (fatty acid hydroxylase superfamily)
MDLITASKVVLGTFSASTATTYLICTIFNIPFFNPKHNRYQFYYNLKQVSISTAIALTQSVLISSIFVNRWIKNEPHTIFQSIDNIIRYSIIAEFIYYIYHRTIHTREYYKKVHAMHHENVDVYPFDTFYMTKMDSLFLVGSLGAPIVFLNLNYYELVFTLYVYITAAYFEHSNIFFIDHHAIHHKLIFCNYCILNPMFDILFGTYR